MCCQTKIFLKEEPGDDLDQVSASCFDSSKPPLPRSIIPDYSWQFMGGVWCLVPKNHLKNVELNHQPNEPRSPTANWDDEEVFDGNLEEDLVDGDGMYQETHASPEHQNSDILE